MSDGRTERSAIFEYVYSVCVYRLAYGLLYCPIKSLFAIAIKC